MTTERTTFVHSCIHCSDTGWISAVHKITKASYAFRCGVCKAAERLGMSKTIPLWTNASKANYESYNEFMKQQKKETV